MRKLQKLIIQELKVKSVINPELEVRNSINFIKSYLKKYSFIKSLILGISGGQDSTLAGKLCQMAIEEMRKETSNLNYKFIAVRLPYGKQSDEKDAMDSIKFIHADKCIRVNIKDSTDSIVKSIQKNNIIINDFNKGNIKSRERMIAQYSIANIFDGIVVGTDHAAEAVTGFYTKYGDGGSDITPLWRLDKRQGKQLLKYLNAPQNLYNKIPTADLEDNRPLLPDEVALGICYDDIDDYLEGKDIGKSKSKIIEDLYLKTKHKRHLPINIYDEL